jgi:hypothetical protein
MYVWREWPQFFRGAGGLIQRLRLNPSSYDVRARLVWSALSDRSFLTFDLSEDDVAIEAD